MALADNLQRKYTIHALFYMITITLNVPAERPFNSPFPLFVTVISLLLGNDWRNNGHFIPYMLADVPFIDCHTSNNCCSLLWRTRKTQQIWVSYIFTGIRFKRKKVFTNAVDSAIVGRITSNPIRSACSCSNTSFDVMPPSTCNFTSRNLQSFDIASKISRTWKQTASSVARKIWPRCVSSVRP